MHRVNHTLGNLFGKFGLLVMDLDKYGPFSDIMATVAFYFRSTKYNNLKENPVKIIYRRDVLCNIKHTE